MTMRLIDGDKAKLALDWDLVGDTADAACRVIDNAPTVDAVVVTRCKDCKHCTKFANSEMMVLCEKHDIVMLCDGFCSCGEPKVVMTHEN